MSRICFLLLLLSLVSVGIAQEKHIYDPNAQVRGVPEFHSIVAAGSVNLFISTGERRVVVSAADREDADAIEAVVENGVLQIRFKGEERKWKAQKMYNRRLTAYISEKDIKGLTVSGSGNIQIDGTLKTKAFTVRLFGSGNITGRIAVDRLDLQQSGSGNIRISGEAGNADISASGSGNLNCPDLRVDFCTLAISGSGNAFVTVNRSLTASVSGSGNIRYKGAGELVHSKTSGSGRIQKVSS